jgi:4-amino-4-deoxychorismate lyase
VSDVELEAAVSCQLVGERREHLGRDLRDTAAGPADEVRVLLLADRVVGGRAVREVRVGHQPELFEQFQCPVNCGDVDPGRSLGHLRVYLVRRCVAEPVYGIEHQLTLRGQPEPSRAKLLRQGGVGHTSMVCGIRLPGVIDQRVVALLGVGVVPADTPILRADDLGAVRGDGIFETMHVRAGRPWLLDEHLARMARSAAAMDLALPPAEALAELVGQALAPWPAQVEGALRLVCTRGSEADPTGQATVFATVRPVPESARLARHAGISVASAPLGLPADLRATSPWLLGGAKTLSYAVNMASQRWAVTQGADDVLWVSSDGFALEGPTSTLVWIEGSVLHMIPPGASGILAGTTARWLLDHASSLGWTTAERMITPAELHRGDGAWFVSSVRGIAAIHTLDGTAVPHSEPITDAVRTLLGFD